VGVLVICVCVLFLLCFFIVSLCIFILIFY